MAEKLVSIVIVTRNRKKVVCNCLSSVLRMNYSPIEVILIDNGSEDMTLQSVQKKFPKVRIVKAGENLGLNAGKNLGQKKARGEYILFLDSDTTVDKNLLLELVSVAESDPKIGIVCPKMYYADQKNIIWYAGARVNLLTSQTKNIGCNQKDVGQFNSVRETDFAPTAYLVTKEVFNKLKGHDETFFMTYGDTDYGFRARKSGFQVVFCPKAKLWHHLGKEENIKTIRALGFNMPMRAYYFARNRVIFMKKHAPKKNFLIFILFFFPLLTLYYIYKILIFGGGWQFLKPHLEGSMDGLKFALLGKVKNRWF